MNTHTVYVVMLAAVHLATFYVAGRAILRGHRVEVSRDRCSATSCEQCWSVR